MGQNIVFDGKDRIWEKKKFKSKRLFLTKLKEKLSNSKEKTKNIVCEKENLLLYQSNMLNPSIHIIFHSKTHELLFES